MSQKRNMRHSRNQEKRIAGILGGRRHAYSGSRPHQDGDGHVGDNASALDYILLECKRTRGTEQITIKRKDLEKHNREARQVGREPVLCFELDGDYAIVDVHYLAELLDATRQTHDHDFQGIIGVLHDEEKDRIIARVQRCIDPDCDEVREIPMDVEVPR